MGNWEFVEACLWAESLKKKGQDVAQLSCHPNEKLNARGVKKL